MVLAAVLHIDNEPTRVWKGNACIYNAYKWAHHNFYLADEGLKLNELPDDMKITFHIMTEEQFAQLVKQ